MARPDPEAVAERLEGVRRRTLELVSVLDDDTLARQQIEILSPMIWDLGHIANFEELWLCRRLGGRAPIDPRLDRLFDPVANPRPTREALPLPRGGELLAYLEKIRASALEVLAAGDFDGVDPELMDGGFVWEMVAEHEEQHQETLLQAAQVMASPPYAPPRRRSLPPARSEAMASARGGGEAEMVPIEGGRFRMGWSGGGFAYDNERPAHEVELAPFWIDRHPVSEARYLEFVEAGGYRRRELWSDEGWRWRQETGVEAPLNWRREAGGWVARTMDRETPVPAPRPVVHVGYHEAEAFARFAGKRLPSEAEWERAALWDPEAGRARRYPWGDEPPDASRANLDQLAFEPAPLGAFPGGASAAGAEQMLGDVWEWTASDFTAYPAFRAFPYAEYSEIFFGSEFKVLRGGSWATRPRVARGTFRNWDYPIRRQIFAGIRCARNL